MTGVGSQVLTTIVTTLIWSFGKGTQDPQMLSWPRSASPSTVPEGSSCFCKGRKGGLAGRVLPPSPLVAQKSPPGPLGMLATCALLTGPPYPSFDPSLGVREEEARAGERGEAWTVPGPCECVDTMRAELLGRWQSK